MRWWRLPIEERPCRKTHLGGGDYTLRTSGLLPPPGASWENIYPWLAPDVRIVTPGTRCENSYAWHQMRKYFSLMPVWGIYLSRGPNWKNYYPWHQLRKYLSLAPAESMFIPGASWELSLYLYSTLSAVAACQASYPHTHITVHNINIILSYIFPHFY